MNEMEKAQTYKYVDRKKLMQGLKVDEFRKCDNTLEIISVTIEIYLKKTSKDKLYSKNYELSKS